MKDEPELYFSEMVKNPGRFFDNINDFPDIESVRIYSKHWVITRHPDSWVPGQDVHGAP